MTPNVRTGIVKDYDPDRGFGFIKPDAKYARDDGRSIFFHIQYHMLLYEPEPGRLELHPVRKNPTEVLPGVGTHLLYYETEDGKGPRASHWCLLSDAKKAQIVLSKRQNAQRPRLRVQIDDGSGGTTIWEGFIRSEGQEQLRAATRGGRSAKLQMLSVNGWEQPTWPDNSTQTVEADTG